MSEFDSDKYFATKFNSADITNKMAEVAAASRAKVTELKAAQVIAGAAAAQKAADQKASDASWVGQLGLEPGSFPANRVNDAASLVSGTTRLAGQIASLPVNVASFAGTAVANEEDIQAFNRAKAGAWNQSSAAQQADDNMILDRQAVAGLPGTIRDSLSNAEKLRGVSRAINNTTDLSGIVEQTNRNQLNTDMGKDFQANWDKVTGGWDAAKHSDFAKAGSGIVTGVAGLLLNTGKAVLTNPAAAREYIIENAPQLFVGAAGKVGQVAMAASNLGYAADNYQQGLENYAQKNGGQLPPEDQRQHMALLAASLAVAEHAGDHLGLKWMKSAEQEGAALAKTGLIAGAKRSAAAGAEGFGSEAATEGYQQWAEGEVTGKGSTAFDIFNAGVIGGVSGAGLSAGGHAAREMAGASEAHVAQQEAAQGQAEQFATAAAANDPTPYMDAKAPTYDPLKAVGVLFQHAHQDDTTPEVKQENLAKAAEIVSGMEQQHATLKEAVADRSPEGVAAAQEQIKSIEAKIEATDPADSEKISQYKDIIGLLNEKVTDLSDPKKAKAAQVAYSKLDQQLSMSREMLSGLHANVEKQVEPVQVQDLVTQLSTKPVEQGNTDVQAPAAAAEQLINLSMTQPKSISAEVATKLAEDTSNPLTDDQREHLRTFSAARIAENAVSTTDKVAHEVMVGSSKNVGLAQYRQRIATAIAAGNPAMAQTQLGQLSSFADDHAAKFAVADAAIKSNGLGGQLIKTDTGWAIRPTNLPPLSETKLRENGGLNLVSRRLVANIGTEAQALKAGVAEMQSAAQLKFGIAENQSAAVQSNPTPAITATPDISSISLREMRERERRVDGKENLPPTNQKAEAPLTVSNTQQVAPKTETKPAKQTLAERQQFLAEQELKVKAAVAANEQHRAKTAAAQQPATVSEANLAPVANAATSSVQEEEKTNQASEVDSGMDSSSVSVDAASQSQASPVPSSAAPPQTVQPSTAPAASRALSVFDGEHDAKAPYTERNLVATGFKQDAGEGESSRPLASVKDFASAVKSGIVNVSDYLQGKRDVPEVLLMAFMASADKWAGLIQSNMKLANKGYAFEDMSQYLLNAEGKFDENVTTAAAYAIYAWTAENVTRPAYNTTEEINLILGRGEDALVSEAERAALETVGTRQNVVVNALGQKIAAALGLKALASAPRNFQSDLEATLGARALKVMLDSGLLRRETLSGKQMAELTKSAKTETTAEFHFVQLVRDEAGKVNAQAEAIFTNMMGTEAVLDKLFGVEPAMKEPSEKPIESTQKTTRNTSQQIPASLASMVAADDAMPSYVRQDMYKLATLVSEDTMLAIAGKEEVDTTVHKAKRKSLQAKNDGLLRELINFMGYVGKKGADVIMHFEHSVWKQQRVGIATNLINPQTSKIHRHMLYRDSWESEIKLADQDAMTNFRLRVAEGLGVKTDKMSEEAALAKFKELLAKPAIKAAVNVLVKTLDKNHKDPLSENEQAVLKAGVDAGVDAGGSNMHSLDALMALAHYSMAVKAKDDSFKVQMMAEVDGVTNGPMFSHLLLGAANSPEEMFALLNRGGFFEENNPHTAYNTWRDAPGNFDLYETTALHMTEELAKLGLDGNRLASLYVFTGDLIDAKGVVQKAGRNIIKTPLTAMVFGSSVKSAVDSMADKFIESIYSTIEDTANGKEGALATSEILSHLASMGVRLAENTDLMEHEFSTREINILKGEFEQTIGKAVEATMKQDFARFIEQRSQFNTTAQLSFGIYDAVYTTMREELLAQLVKDGEIAVNPTTGKPLHDLSNTQEKILQAKVAALLPMMHTPMSKQSNNLKAGLLVAKTERKLSTSDLYNNVVKFAQPFADGSKSTQVHGYEVNPAGPGVAMVPMSIHSGDSAVSARANMDAHALNIHDAQGAGVNQIKGVATSLNEATWNTMLNYSPAAEIRDTLLRTVAGLDAMIKTGQLSEQVIASVGSVLVDFAEKNETPAEGVLAVQAALSQDMAYRADDMKYSVMGNMGAVNQYAMEGGAYLVGDPQRKAVAELHAKLEAGLAPEQQAIVASVSDQLAAAIKTEQDKRDGKAPSQRDPEQDPVVKAAKPTAALGKSAIASDPVLVKAFTNTPVMGLKQAVALLRQTVKGDFSQKLLSVLERSTASDISIVYVTPQTMPAEMLAAGGDTSRGWYVSKGDQHQIYVLSPEFKQSGLTPELLLHELTHAALARIVANPTEETKPLIAELEELRVKAAALVEAQGLQGSFGDAVSNVQELLAWGMSNQAFQQQVLMGIGMTSKNEGHSLLNGLKSLVDKLVQLLFGKQNATMNSGMYVLVTNAAGLFNQAAQNNKAAQSGNIVLNQTNTGNTNVRDLSTVDVFGALATMNSGSTVSPEFGAHLENLLTGLVAKLHGPFGTFKAAIMEQTAKNPEDVYLDAVTTGVAPFASSSLAAGFSFTHQEAFVLEQVEATVRQAMDSRDGVSSIAYRELAKLYAEVKAKVQVEDLHPGDWATAAPHEKAEAKALHDFIFAMQAGADGKSDYLSRFAALGLAHEGFNKVLKQATETKSREFENLTFNERLNRIFNMVTDWFAGKMTKTIEGQDADAKLTALVTQLVQIESKKKTVLQAVSSVFGSVEDYLNDRAKKSKIDLEAFGKKPFFQNSSSGIVQATGAMLSAYAGARTDLLMQGFLQVRDQNFQSQHGLVAALVNEFQGSHEGNKMFHLLLRASKHIEGIRKDIITSTAKTVTGSFANNGADLTPGQKSALTAVFLRNDVSTLLDHYSMDEITKLVSDPKALQEEIARFEGQLTGVFNQYYSNSAKALGYYKAVGKATMANMMMNAGNIARLYVTGLEHKVSEAEAKAAEKVIDPLVSLYALSYTGEIHLENAQQVLKAEAARTDGGNGVEMILLLHKALQEQSKQNLFNGSEALQMKGYVPEVYDPYMDIRVANAEDGKKLELQGYTKGARLVQDKADNVEELRHIYSLRDGGMKQQLTGIFSYTGMKAKGTRVHNGNLNAMSYQGSLNIVATDEIANAKRPAIADMFSLAGFDPSSVDEQHMVPVLNANGVATNYRYLMTEQVKNDLLDRDNRPEKLLGNLAGSIFDKVNSDKQNKRAVQALHDQYKAEFAKIPASYLTIGPASNDPQLREIWAMLPAATKAEVRKVWGTEGMKVRADLIDLNFGYRKLSIADAFHKDVTQRNFVEGMFVQIMEHAFHEKAVLRTRQFEDIWQAVVKATKSNLVVKSWSTMSGNLRSNWSQLFLMGVNPAAIVKYHRIAFKGAWSYNKDSEALFGFKQQLETGYLQPGQSHAFIKSEIIRLEDAIARNPVKPLIDAGLMPSIVEDVQTDDDIYSYKSKFVKKTEEYTSRLNPHVVKAGREALMLEGSTAYKAMSYATQISDFLARYTLYEAKTAKGMSHEEAIQLASDAFINYDVPTHRLVQYANDSGLVMFTKYYMRIQKMLGKIYKQHPARVLAVIAMEKILGDQPTVLDSGMTHRWGNPINMGALDYPGSLDALTTVRFVTAPFRTAARPE